MGATKLSLTELDLNQSKEIYLKLTDPARPLKDLGELKVVATLMPKTQEDKEQVIACAEFNFSHVKTTLYVDFRNKKFCYFFHTNQFYQSQIFLNHHKAFAASPTAYLSTLPS